jgi:hypothetical protein
MVNHAERGNPDGWPSAMLGRYYRKACCSTVGTKKLEEANAVWKSDG